MMDRSQNVDRSQAKLGGGLVTEFFAEVKMSLLPSEYDSIHQKMLQCVKARFGCDVEALRITDEEANKLIEELYVIACERDLKVARMPFNSK
jgi:hypothetical protein